MDVLGIVFIVAMSLILISFIVILVIESTRHKKEMLSIYLENSLYYANKIKDLKVDSIDEALIKKYGKDPRLEVFCKPLIETQEKIKKLMKIKEDE